MKNSILLLAIAVSVSFAASCTKEIEFTGEETAPCLVLYSLATPGEPLTANLSTSVFFLKNNYDNKLFTSQLDTLRGTVKVFVNGAQTPYVMRYSPAGYSDDYYYYVAPSTLRYVSDYVPSEGDRIRIVAEFPGLPAAEGETIVPRPGNLSILSSKKSLSAEEDVSFDVSARLKDDGSYAKYYSIKPARLVSSDGGESFWIERWGTVSSNDMIFMGSASDMTSLLGDDNEISGYFSDELFRGGTCDFRFSFNMGREYESYIYDDYPGEEYQYRYTLLFTTMTPGLYNHILSMNNLSYSEFGFFGESSTVYSNVKGGYGCVCSSVSLSLSLNNP